MTTARHKVLNYFNKTRTASAREISRALKLSTATVRHHLRVLVSDGRLEMLFVRGLDRRGRPEKIYSLPRAALGNNLSALSDAVLSEAGPEFQMGLLAKRLAGESSPGRQPLARRLNLAVEKLNQMNYHAHWEAGSEGPRILFSHCPYAAIIEKHPGLCRMDGALLKEFTGETAAQISKTGQAGSSVCVFLIG